jgi:hypothetical protein
VCGILGHPGSQSIFYETCRHGILLGKGATPRGQDIQSRGLEVVPTGPARA